MTITAILVAEHTIFLRVFDQIERALPQSQTLSEVQTMARIVEGLLEQHGRSERDLAFAALDHALAERGRLEKLHQEHEEIDQTLRNTFESASLAEASKNLMAALAFCRRHFCFEETMVFPLIEQVLQGETLKSLGQEWARTLPVKEVQAA